MAIEFRCATIVSYDALTEKYVLCDEVLIAPDNLVAKFVVCPKCQTRSLVPLSATALPNTPAETHVSAKSREAILESSSPAAVASAASNLTFTSFNHRTRCNRCGGQVGEDLRCQTCGHQTALLIKNSTLELDKIQIAGCQRWLAQKLAIGTGTEKLLAAAHVFITVLLVVLASMAIGMGGPAAIVVFILIAVSGGTYAYFVYEFWRISRRPPGALAWWQRIVWNGVLNYYRKRRWQPNSPQIRWQVLDLRNQSLDDDQILTMPNLTSYHVIDLEGNRLTDDGLAKLQGLGRLQRLVLCRNPVTPQAIFALQQRLLDVWIWS